MTKKAAKTQRLIDLARAQLAALEGRTAEAVALFSKHGISFISYRSN